MFTMRLHTKLDDETIRLVAWAMKGVRIERYTVHGSRQAPRAVEVILSGSGRAGGQYGDTGVKSATWDEWGIFLRGLYRLDPAMIAGTAYLNYEHFTWVTTSRYETLTPDAAHVLHRWEHVGRSVTGAYHLRKCTCGAQVRTIARGHTWAEISPDYAEEVTA